jgi:hypothetical protein
VHGPYPRGYRISSWVANQIVAASVTDLTIGRRSEEVTQVLLHPSSLTTPGTLFRTPRQLASAATVGPTVS